MSALPSNATYLLSELAERVNGTVTGDGATTISGVCSIDETQPGCISYATTTSIESLKRLLEGARCSAILVSQAIPTEQLPAEPIWVQVENPTESMLALIPLFFRDPILPRQTSDKADIHPTAQIGSDVHIGAFTSVGPEAIIEDGATIYPHVTIYEQARIGARSVIHAGVVIRERCSVGPDCVIQNGVVIGADGFGYVPDKNYELIPVPQVGTTEVEDKVDIGANTCIDRAALGTTVIGKGSKLDNLVQVGHNVKIGRHSVLCGQVGVGGSTKIGDHVTLGGQVGVSDHISIGNGCRVGSKGGVHSSINTPGDYLGNPAMPRMSYLRQTSTLQKVQSILRELKTLRKEFNG